MKFLPQKSLIKNIKFWLILSLLIRLYGITNPPIEVAHNWRQTTVTMVARNFYEVDANIFYPRIDFAGEKTGITGMEFPLLNYLIYLVSLIFGYNHWYGRLINLIVSIIGIFFFYKIIKKYFNINHAFYSAIILICSLWFAYSRKIMPDTFSTSLVLMCIYYGTNLLDKNKLIKNLCLYFIFGLLGILAKLPSGFLLVVFIPFFFTKDIKLNRKFLLIISSLLMLIPIAYWYFIWVPYLVNEYGFWHFFMGKSFLQGANEIFEHFPKVLKRFYDTPMKFTAFLMFLIGIYKSFHKKNKQLLIIFLLTFLSFMVFVLKAGYHFPHHNYYILPFIPVLALVAGYGISYFKKKIIYIVLVIIGLEGIANQQHEFHFKKRNAFLLNIERDLDKYSSSDDLILINCGENPTPMYFAHRKGWIATNKKIQNSNYLEDIKLKGCKYILVIKKSFAEDIILNYEQIFNNEFYRIYKL